jgi:hypothetical protein
MNRMVVKSRVGSDGVFAEHGPFDIIGDGHGRSDELALESEPVDPRL